MSFKKSKNLKKKKNGNDNKLKLRWFYEGFIDNISVDISYIFENYLFDIKECILQRIVTT